MATSAIDIIKTIGQITITIYKQTQLAKANQAQCNRLYERVMIVNTAIQKLETISNIERFKPALESVHDRLKNCLELISEFSSTKVGKINEWLKKINNFIQAGAYKEKFASLNKELLDAIIPLNLGLNAQQVFNYKDDPLDQKKDLEELIKLQAEILKQNQEQNNHLKELKKQQKEMINNQELVRLEHDHNHQLVIDKINSLKQHLLKAQNVQRSPSAPMSSINLLPTSEMKALHDSNSVPQDKLKTADEYYNKACQYYAKNDFNHALQYYKIADTMGHIKAKTSLGYHYLQGKGTHRDIKTAFELFTISAGAGHTRAMVNLARMYESGLYTAKDVVSARIWYETAALHGNKQAQVKIQSYRQLPNTITNKKMF